MPQRGTCWRTARGSAVIWTPAPTLLVIALRDYCALELAEPVLSAYGAMAAEGGLHLFFDAEQLTNYDSQFRAALTKRFLPDRLRLQTFHVLVRSKIVAMGVSVANLALGGIVSATNERKAFLTALDSKLFAEGARGFSSNVLSMPAAPLARMG